MFPERCYAIAEEAVRKKGARNSAPHSKREKRRPARVAGLMVRNYFLAGVAADSLTTGIAMSWA